MKILCALAFSLFFIGCEKKIEFENLNPCEWFNRVNDHYSWNDSAGTILNYSHSHQALSDIQLCGKGDIDYAHQGPEVRVIKSIDSSTMILFVDSQITVLTSK